MTATLQSDISYAFNGDLGRAERALNYKPAFVRVEPVERSQRLWGVLAVEIGLEGKAKEALEEWGGEVRPIQVQQFLKPSKRIKRVKSYLQDIPGYVMADLTTGAHRQNIMAIINIDRPKMNKRIYGILQQNNQDFLMNSVQYEAFCVSLQDGSFDRKYLEVFNDFDVGETLRATEGPFSGYSGKVQSEGELFVKVAIECMGRSVPLELRKGEVEKVA